MATTRAWACPECGEIGTFPAHIPHYPKCSVRFTVDVGKLTRVLVCPESVGLDDLDRHFRALCLARGIGPRTASDLRYGAQWINEDRGDHPLVDRLHRLADIFADVHSGTMTKEDET